MSKKVLYPAVQEAEEQRLVQSITEDEEPDWKDGAPNYDKFKGWSPEQVLVWLNID